MKYGVTEYDHYEDVNTMRLFDTLEEAQEYCEKTFSKTIYEIGQVYKAERIFISTTEWRKT